MGDGNIEGKGLGKGTEGREGSDRFWQVEGKEGRWELVGRETVGWRG